MASMPLPFYTFLLTYGLQGLSLCRCPSQEMHPSTAWSASQYTALVCFFSHYIIQSVKYRLFSDMQRRFKQVRTPPGRPTGPITLTESFVPAKTFREKEILSTSSGGAGENEIRLRPAKTKTAVSPSPASDATSPGRKTHIHTSPPRPPAVPAASSPAYNSSYR